MALRVGGRGARVSAAAIDAGAGPNEVTYGELFTFMAPTAALWLVNPIMSLVDTAVVGATSAVQLAALAPGTVLCDHTCYIFNFLAIATTNLIASQLAQADAQGAGDTLSDALAVALGLGLTYMISLHFLGPLYLQNVAGASAPELIQPAMEYVKWRSVGLPAVLVAQVAQAFFIAAKAPKVPLLATVLAGLLNLGGDVVLCKCWGMGIAGAAIATSAAQIITAVILLWALGMPVSEEASPFAGLRVPWVWHLPSFARAYGFLRVAGPAGVVLAVKVIAHAFLNSIATSIGALPAAAHQVAFTLFVFLNTLADGISQASQAFMPGLVGRPSSAWALAWKACSAALVVALCSCASAAAVLTFATAIFTNSAAVAAAVTPLAGPCAGCLLISTVSLSMEGMLFAGRQQRLLMFAYILNAATVWGAVQVGQALDLGIFTVWLGIFQFNFMRLILNGSALVYKGSFLNSRRPLDVALRPA